MSDPVTPEPTRVSRIFPTVRPLQRYFAQRADPLTNLFLVLPLFIVYHVGVVSQVRVGPDGRYQWVGNGVDFLTGTALSLAHGNVLVYAAGAVVVTLVLTALILWARKRSGVHPRLFVPLLIESTVYAVLVAGVIGYIVDAIGLGVLDGEGFGAQVISSCGAGLHEELVFRMGLFHGSAWLASRRVQRPWMAWVVAGLVTSALFSAVHYLGPLGDRFSLSSFAFRFFLGGVLAIIYRYRGFAVAAWTHTLYDVLYFLLRRL
jgi:hypothetical protein